MHESFRELLVRSIRLPIQKDPNADLEWFCESLGIVGERDKERTGFKIFKVIIETSQDKQTITINDLATKVNLSRTSVVHHLKNLEDSGIVMHTNRRIELRMPNLQNLVDELFADFERSFSRIKQIAEEIDREMGLPVRE